MNNNIRNALEVLKQAVLQVLYEQYRSGVPHRRFMTIKEIGEHLDIRPIGKYTHMNSLTHGIPLHLLDDGYAEWLGELGRWQITEEGVSVIEGSRRR